MLPFLQESMDSYNTLHVTSLEAVPDMVAVDALIVVAGISVEYVGTYVDVKETDRLRRIRFPDRARASFDNFADARNF